MGEGSFRTWDGLPVSREQPYGATVAVWRRNGDEREWLILHRRHHGPEFAGEWAWTPPSGARFPGEEPEACARRELAEETGLALVPRRTPCGRGDWAVFAAEAPPSVEVRLDAEHDRFRWVALEEARERCLPARVAEQLACVDAWLGGRSPAPAPVRAPQVESRGVRAYVSGIYARSEALVQATRDLDRGRTTADAVEEQRERDLQELVAAQEEAGLDPLADGMLAAQDLWRPLAEAAEGLEARPLVRFLDTNTFYRGLLVSGEPRLRDALPAPELPEGRWLGTLPSPLSFARAVEAGEASARTLAEHVLAPQIEAWSAAGCALVVLDEPLLAREPAGVDELADALECLPRSVPLHLRLPFCDAGPLLAAVADLAVDGVGVDFHATSLDDVPESFPREIAAGVLDARGSAVEQPDEVARFVDALAARAPAGISLTTNGDLQFVPEAIARQKVVALGRAAARVAEGAIA